MVSNNDVITRYQNKYVLCKGSRTVQARVVEAHLHKESGGVEKVVLIVPPRHGCPDSECCQVSGHLQGIAGNP